MASKKTGGDRPKIKTSHKGDKKSDKGDKPERRERRPAPRKPRSGMTPATARARAEHAAAEREAPKTQRPSTRKPAAPPGPGEESLASPASRVLAVEIAIAAIDKKAVGIEILDVAGKVDYADFLVLMTGRSDRHVAALSQGIEEALRRKNKRPMAVEGMPQARWVLMDYGDVVVHVFQDEMRGVYDLEGLWMDARRIPVPHHDEQ